MTTYPPRCERAQLTCVFLQNAPSHGAAPPSGWEGANFDDSAWPQATTFGQNAQQDGEPNVPIWRRVKGSPIPDIADDAHWIWTPDNDGHNDIFCRVTVVEATGAQSCVDFSTTTTYEYDPYFHPTPLGDSKCVTFTLKASNDGHVAFFEQLGWGGHGSKHYEIVYSGWGNTQSVHNYC